MDISYFYQHYGPALFTASVTIGVFVFTMKSFVVQGLKKEVYDNPRYSDYVRALNNLASRGGGSVVRSAGRAVYEPLQNLAHALTLSIVAALLNALVQLLLPLFSQQWVLWICFFANAATWFVLGRAVHLVTRNISIMLRFSEWVFDNPVRREL